jgi:peptidyl-prolyl cis-trans isomerase NIMA-interacting 1
MVFYFHFNIYLDEALELLKGYLKLVKENPSIFSELAGQYSDCSSARKGGDLGWFGKNEMHRPFEDASFKLNVNEISDIVETTSGLHIIMRLE